GVRITAQLIDASTGAHLWADHFDGGIENIFDLQDQVAANVVGAVSPELEYAEIERAKRKPTESLDAYDYFLRGLASAHRVTRDATDEALTLFSRAIELDPDFAAPCGAAAFCYVVRKLNGWMTAPPEEVAEAARLARRAAKVGKNERWRSHSPGLRSAMWPAPSRGRSRWSIGRWCSMRTWRPPGTPAAPCGRFAAGSRTWPSSTFSGQCA